MLPKGRLEAFSDGVIAIIITIMVLDIETPTHVTTLDLRIIMPFLHYLISFLLVGTYWIHHYSLMQVPKTVNHRMIWVNLLFLFFLSIMPWATKWLGMSQDSQRLPFVFYCVLNLLTTISFILLERVTIHMTCGLDIIRNYVHESTRERAMLFVEVMALFCASMPKLRYAAMFFLAAGSIYWGIPNQKLQNILRSIEYEGLTCPGPGKTDYSGSDSGQK